MMERSPTATLRFHLPEHLRQFEDACNGEKYRLVIEEMDHRFRSMAKHGGIAWAQEARDILRQIVEENEVRIG